MSLECQEWRWPCTKAVTCRAVDHKSVLEVKPASGSKPHSCGLSESVALITLVGCATIERLPKGRTGFINVELHQRNGSGASRLIALTTPPALQLTAIERLTNDILLREVEGVKSSLRTIEAGWGVVREGSVPSICEDAKMYDMQRWTMMKSQIASQDLLVLHDDLKERRRGGVTFGRQS
jgi:hypothetical protein